MLTTTIEQAVRDQRDGARELANRVRLGRAHAYCDLENGDMTLAAALADPMLASATIHSVLERLPFTGKARVRRDYNDRAGARRCPAAASRMLRRLMIFENKTVGTLTDRQVAAIVAEWEAQCRSNASRD